MNTTSIGLLDRLRRARPDAADWHRLKDVYQPLIRHWLTGILSQLEDPNSDLAWQWDREHHKHVLQKLLAVVRPDLDPLTWRVFTPFALDGLSAAAQELAVSESAVVQAKHRILKRLREEAGDFMS